MTTTDVKTCTKCKNEQLTSQFSLRSSEPLKYTSHCKTCTRARWKKNSEKESAKKKNKYATDAEYREAVLSRNKAYRRKDQKNRNKVSREKHQFYRKSVISTYGGACTCCGESYYQFLAIDHINGGGHKHRKKVGSTKLIRDLFLLGKVDPKYRILCHNCNSALGFYGYCPHEKE